MITHTDVRRCKRPFCEGLGATFGGAQIFLCIFCWHEKEKTSRVEFSQFFREHQKHKHPNPTCDCELGVETPSQIVGSISSNEPPLAMPQHFLDIFLKSPNPPRKHLRLPIGDWERGWINYSNIDSKPNLLFFVLFLYLDKPRGALPLTMCRNIVT
jgi:hypothetical protein